MRISDWSSDVCSSDLHDHRDARRRNGSAHAFESAGGNRLRPRRDRPGAVGSAGDGQSARSEERRVGKECVSTGRSRWSAYHSNNNTATYDRYDNYKHKSSNPNYSNYYITVTKQ